MGDYSVGDYNGRSRHLDLALLRQYRFRSNDIVGGQFLQVCIGQSQYAFQDFLIVLSQRRRRAQNRVGTSTFPERRRSLVMPAEVFAVDELPEAARMQMLVIEQLG